MVPPDYPALTTQPVVPPTQSHPPTCPTLPPSQLKLAPTASLFDRSLALKTQLHSLFDHPKTQVPISRRPHKNLEFMETHQKLKLLFFTLIPPFVLLLVLCLLFCYFHTRRFQQNPLAECECGCESKSGTETLIGFSGGEELTIQQILDAPGEVVAKSSYGTLYRAGFVESGSVVMMKFLRPGCAGRKEEEAVEAVRVIGSARHPNLVPLMAMYGGGGGEKLLVYPFCEGGDLGQFLKGEIFLKKITF